MLLEPTATTIPARSPPLHSLRQGGDSLTEEYGETEQSGRTATGGVDFFSSIGTEHRPKKKTDILESEKVSKRTNAVGTEYLHISGS